MQLDPSTLDISLAILAQIPHVPGIDKPTDGPNIPNIPKALAWQKEDRWSMSIFK